jgi:hypothetical protein
LLTLLGCGATSADRAVDAAGERGDAPHDGTARDGRSSGDAAQDAARPTDGGTSSDGPPGDASRRDGGVGGGCASGLPSVQCVAAAAATDINGTIAVDDVNVYWTAFGQGYRNGVVLRVARSGGTPATLLAADAFSIVSDGTDVYAGVPDDAGSYLVRVPVDGGAPQTVTTTAVGCLAVDDANVYWPTAQGLAQVPKTGGTVATIATTPYQSYYGGIALDDTNVYWGGAGSIFRASKKGGPATVVVSASAGIADIEPASSCHFLALAGGALYAPYGAQGEDFPATALGSFSPTGSDAGALMTIGAGDAPILVAAHATNVFWTGLDPTLTVNEISTAPGSAAHRLVAPPVHAINDMVVASDGTLYWTTDFQVQSLVP